ncbi:hypothetical protein [Glycomyces sp. NPDC021274]|uniref:hypothetical protein n=1 Tax=Glycomyces sp. NPDC021274 TaxID=3155120 RepID=UPI00340F91B3
MSGHVVVVLFTGGQVGRVNRFVAEAGAAGVAVTVLTAEGGQAWKRGNRIEGAAAVHSIGRAENRQPLVWLYLACIERGPGIVLDRAAKRVPGLPGRAFGKLASLHRKVAKVIRRRVFWPVYRLVRPQALRAIARRRTGPLDLDGADRVVIVDNAAVPFGWGLTRRRPGLRVTRRLDSFSAD